MNHLKKIIRCIQFRLLPLIALTGMGSVRAEITVDGVLSWAASGGTNIFDASGSDKLVVVIAGEHNFNQSAGGQVNGVTYDGEPLIKAVDIDPSKLADGGHGDTLADIWYLDHPGDFHNSGTILASVAGNGNNYVYTVLGLSGTAEGVGSTGKSAGTASVNLSTTGANSLVVSSIGLGGAGNTSLPLPVTAAPDGSTLLEGVVAGNAWAAHVVSYVEVGAPSSQTFSFETDKTDVATVAVEFLSSGGGSGLPFAITDIAYFAEMNEVTLTWPKTGSPSYVVKFSRDLSDWSGDLDDSVTPEQDEDLDDAQNITVTLPLPEELGGAPSLFFRVETNSN